MTYQKALAYLYARLPMFQRVGAPALKYDLSNTRKLLDAIGNPQDDFKCVHIAGTNGKGSSAHAIAAILSASGYKTGLFTSPHLKSFTERAKVDGLEMSEAFVSEFVSDIQPAIELIDPSFFEVTFAMAVSFFAKSKVDIAVIETGLGGRLDSTNVITPIACLITMIGWDHADLLGDSLEKIASEKAGIIKSGVPVVIGAEQPELLHVFADQAKALNAPLFSASQYRVEQTLKSAEGVVLDVYNHGELLLKALKLDITAGYFQKNLPGVLKLIETLREHGWTITDENIREGLAYAKEKSGLKGRWQVLGHSPKIVADISHNLPGLQALFEQVTLENPSHLHIIFGVVKDKSVDTILELLATKPASFYFTQSSVPRSLSALALQQKAATFGLNGDVFEDVNVALDTAKKQAA